MGAEVAFEQSLEHCLQELVQTGDVASCLERYPQYAEQLRPLLELAQATRQHYEVVPPAPAGLAAGRQRFLEAAAQGRPQGNPIAAAPRRSKLALGRRLRLALPLRLAATIMAVILSIALLGGGMVWAAQDSVPGDPLYAIKLTAEDLRLALTSDPGGKVDLALQLMETRSGEMQALAAAGRDVPEQPLARMEQHIEEALNRAAWADESEMPGLLTRIAERTRTQAQALEQAQGEISEQARVKLARAAAVCQQGAAAAAAGLQDPEAFQARYRQRHGGPDPAGEPQQHQEQQQNGQGQDVRPPRGNDEPPQPPDNKQGPQASPQGQGVEDDAPVPSRGPRGTDQPDGASGQGTPTTATPPPGSQGPGETDQPDDQPGEGSPPTAEPPGPQGPGGTHEPDDQPEHGPPPTAEPPGPQGPGQDPGEPDTAQPTAQGSQATPEPQATPHGSQATAEPQATPQGSQATAAPQPPSQGPPATPEPPPQGSGGGEEQTSPTPSPDSPGSGPGSK